MLPIFNPELKPYVYNCFYSLIKKKILHPDIYDMIDYMREAYLKSFREMACKGFYSYDRSLDDESIYVLVCSPEKDERPVEGIQLLEVNDEIEFVDDFSSFGIKNNVFDL